MLLLTATHTLCVPTWPRARNIARQGCSHHFFYFQGWEADTGVTKGTLGVHSRRGQAEKGDILARVECGHGVHWALVGSCLYLGCGVPVVCCPHYVVWVSCIMVGRKSWPWLAGSKFC